MGEHRREGHRGWRRFVKVVGGLSVIGLSLAGCSGEPEGASTSPAITSALTTSSAPVATTTGVTATTAPAEEYRVYQDAEEMAAALETAGVGCETVEVAGPEMMASPTWGGGLASWVECGWPASGGQGGFLAPLLLVVAESDSARVSFTGLGLFTACSMLEGPPATQAYAYGPDWVVMDGYGDTPLAGMETLASALGGIAAEVSCSQLLEVGSNWQEFPPKDVFVAAMEAVLGESDFPGVDPASFPEAIPPPAVTVWESKAPETAAVVGDTLVAFSYDQACAWEPPDAATFECVVISPDDYLYLSISQVIGTSSGFVGVGDSFEGPVVAHSENGRDWATIDLPGDGRLTSVAQGPGGLLATGFDGDRNPTAWTSADGINWEQYSQPAPAGTLLGVQSADARLLAANDSGYVVVTQIDDTPGFFSTDLITWESGDTPAGARALGSYAGLFILVTRDFEGPGSIWISEDGTSWQEAVSDLEADGYLAWVVPGEDRVLVVLDDSMGSVSPPVILSSEDGRAWSPVMIDGLDDLDYWSGVGTVVWGPGGFYMTGLVGEGVAWSMWSSPTGEVWQRAG